ncbi:MAG: pilus assembly protein PilM [Acidobacteriota bacterium]|nr:pilus assembly protein PilM [Acidobacteriota bacterium]MDH3783858.1 pilus assembly protein PilM [Acidobacteriota bacterium]
MATVTDILERIRTVDLESQLGLRAPSPPVVVSLVGDDLSLIRVKPSRRGKPVLEAVQSRTLSEGVVPTSIFDANPADAGKLTLTLRELLEASGTRPGRASLVLPDNLAKVSLFTLPERPANRRVLDELVRAKMRKAIPFRLKEASLSYESLPSEGKGVTMLVVVVRRSLTDRFEQAFEACGCRLGLIDLSTPNLLNLCREKVTEAGDGDTAILNCAGTHFSLVIMRNQNIIFYRSKSLAQEPGEGMAANSGLLRELSSSFSYYEEKLGGEGVGRVILRNVANDNDALEARLGQIGCGRIETLTSSDAIDLAPGVGFSGSQATVLAPAIGVVAGRG